MSQNSRTRVPTSQEIDQAQRVVAQALAPTPLLSTELALPAGPTTVRLKMETAQPIGAFKVRGGVAAMASLAPGRTAVSASAGNHAQGMAWGANHLGRSAVVVTPTNASATKVQRIKALAARPASQVRLIQHGDSYDQAEARALELCAEDPDAAYVSAYSDYAVIAGATSLGAELDQQLGTDTPITLVVPVGGGGLCSGLALWARGRGRVNIVAVEAAASTAVSASARAGRVTDVQVLPTLADGLAGNLDTSGVTPGILGEAEISGVLSFVTVTEPEIEQAIRHAFSALGQVLEGAGAAAMGAVMAGKATPGNGQLVVICSGRNITPEAYAQVLHKG